MSILRGITARGAPWFSLTSLWRPQGRVRGSLSRRSPGDAVLPQSPGVFLWGVPGCLWPAHRPSFWAWAPGGSFGLCQSRCPREPLLWGAFPVGTGCAVWHSLPDAQRACHLCSAGSAQSICPASVGGVEVTAAMHGSHCGPCVVPCGVAHQPGRCWPSLALRSPFRASGQVERIFGTFAFQLTS